MADTPTGETVTPGDSQTTVPTPAASTANASDPAEAERLRKAKEQSDLRIRQLENEAAARQKADEEAKAKQLEEKEEWKTLYEKEKTERETLLAEQQTAAQKAEADTKAKEVFAKFSPEVVRVAEAAGMSLSDASPEAVSQLESKLQTIAETVKAPGVTGNNPAPQAPRQPGEIDADTIQAMRYGNKDARRKYIKDSPSIQAVKTELQKRVGVFSPNL